MDVLRGDRSAQSTAAMTTFSSIDVRSTEEYQQLLAEMKRWKQQADLLQEEKEELAKVGVRIYPKKRMI